MKQSEVCEEIARILSAIKGGGADVPSFSHSVKPSIIYVCAFFAIYAASVIPILISGDDRDVGLVLGLLILSIVFNVFIGFFIFVVYAQYLSIPEEIRNKSPLIILVRGKVLHYLYFHFGVLLVFSSLFLASGVSGFLPFFQLALFLITRLVMYADLSRLGLPSISGIIDFTKYEFKKQRVTKIS